MLEGYAEERSQQNRRIAQWMAPLLSATCGQKITPGQLLGEEASEASSELSMEEKIRQGQKKIAATMRKVAKAHKQRKRGA
jgi:hypothetical protein